MSEKSEQGIDERQVEPLSHKRILVLMACAAVFGSILCSVFVSASFGVGVLIGGILSVVNYYWLKRSLKVVFDEALAGGKPQFLTARYFMRYLTLGAVLAVVYLTQLVPIVAVLVGLASFAAAITIEGLIRLFSSFSNK